MAKGRLVLTTAAGRFGGAHPAPSGLPVPVGPAVKLRRLAERFVAPAEQLGKLFTEPALSGPGQGTEDLIAPFGSSKVGLTGRRFAKPPGIKQRVQCRSVEA